MLKTLQIGITLVHDLGCKRSEFLEGGMVPVYVCIFRICFTYVFYICKLCQFKMFMLMLLQYLFLGM